MPARLYAMEAHAHSEKRLYRVAVSYRFEGVSSAAQRSV